MKKLAFVAAVVVLAGLSSLTPSMTAKPDVLPRIPGATLLLGFPPYRLLLTTQDNVLTLQNDPLGDDRVSPSISADGNTVASAHHISGGPSTSTPRLVVSTYSVADKKWMDHPELDVLAGTIAISPDGTKIACNTPAIDTAPSGLRVLDLKTGNVSQIPKIPEDAAGFTWSPDGRQLAFDAPVEPGPKQHRGIFVFDIATVTVTNITAGITPSWSPSGEWIAFVEDLRPQEQQAKVNQYRVSRVRPNGKDAQVLLPFRSNVLPVLKAVWSPDSKMLLINIARNPDKDIWNADLLDLASVKVTKEFQNTPPIFGWVNAR